MERIEFERVSKRYVVAPGIGRAPKVIEALRDVSLSLPAGRVYGVVGPNGAGKSTLFALLLGFVFPTAGQIRIDGAAPRDYTRYRGASYLPERFSLPGEWTVRSALGTLARLEGLPAKAARDHADAAMERLGLVEHAAKPLGTLSRGLLQRVGLAQALLATRDLVVLDEPTEGLDPIWRIRFRDMVKELRDAERTVLLASHDLAEVERLADRVILLDAGRVVNVLELATGAEAPSSRRYRLELAAPTPAVSEMFPGAELASSGEPGESGDVVAAYLVDVVDAADLSARLAALLATGARIGAVQPVYDRLEERVRRALADGEAAR